MSTPAQEPGRAAVIRVDPLEGRSTALGELLRAAPAWLISAGIHGALFALFYALVGDPRSFASDVAQEAPIETINTKIEAPPPDLPLTNVEEGLDPTVPTNYDVSRIDDVSVPGPVDPNAAVGVAGAPEGPPVTVPAPPGSGRGQGGSMELPDIDGSGVAREMAGGYGIGLRNVPGGFAGRSGATRERMALEGGGSPASEAAVARGLQWLALHQSPQGNWSLDRFHLSARKSLDDNKYFNDNGQGRGMSNDTAATAFGLLPFLAAGITHKPGTGEKAKQDNKYNKTVARALTWLMDNQGRDGRFGGGMYAHGLASIALCEAYGLTSDPNLKKSAQASINFIVSAQDPNGGGWRYEPRSGGDTSVVGWQVMALKSAQMSGLNVPSITLKAAEKYLDSVQEPGGKGGYGYTTSEATYTMTAVGLLCRQYLGVPRRNPALRDGVERILMENPPGLHKNIYYEYYATQVMHHMGGDAWEFWNKGKKPDGKSGMRELLIARQVKDPGPHFGSWDPRGDAHGGQGGRIMQTSLSLLTLEVYYRHLPLYQRVKTTK